MLTASLLLVLLLALAAVVGIVVGVSRRSIGLFRGKGVERDASPRLQDL